MTDVDRTVRCIACNHEYLWHVQPGVDTTDCSSWVPAGKTYEACGCPAFEPPVPEPYDGPRLVAEASDPQPPTLREQVARAWCADYYGEDSGSAKNPAPDQLAAADAVLAVVADAILGWHLTDEVDASRVWINAERDTRDSISTWIRQGGA